MCDSDLFDPQLTYLTFIDPWPPSLMYLSMIVLYNLCQN